MKDIQKYKKQLEEERLRLTEELATVGRKSNEDSNNWEPKEGAHDETYSDPNDVADNIEELATNVAIELPLEKRLETVTLAIARIEDGTYGICSAGGTDHEIEEARLDANPAANTCTNHINEEI